MLEQIRSPFWVLSRPVYLLHYPLPLEVIPTMSPIDIRPLTSDDIPVVQGVYASVLDPSYISFSELAEGKGDALGQLTEQAPAIFGEQLSRLWQEPDQGYFVAVCRKEIVGFVLCSVHETEGGHMECWVDDIAVRADHQRRGIAKQLMDHALEWGRQHHAKYFLLESGIKNSAHYLFEELGFKPLSIVFCLSAASPEAGEISS